MFGIFKNRIPSRRMVTPVTIKVVDLEIEQKLTLKIPLTILNYNKIKFKKIHKGNSRLTDEEKYLLRQILELTKYKKDTVEIMVNVGGFKLLYIVNYNRFNIFNVD